MRLTTGEVRSYDKKIELGYNHKKERRQIILDSQHPITVRLIDVAKIKRKIRVYVKKQIRFPTICYNTNGRKSYQSHRLPMTYIIVEFGRKNSFILSISSDISFVGFASTFIFFPFTRKHRGASLSISDNLRALRFS